jgi:Na+-transporting NADH:ubiquinone oxidoreductase subunit C
MKPALGLIKGKVDSSTPNAEYKIDGLSGATLTSNGVTNLVQFWMGENGYAPFLANLRAGGA